jgi:hypothetical protein
VLVVVVVVLAAVTDEADEGEVAISLLSRTQPPGRYYGEPSV